MDRGVFAEIGRPGAVPPLSFDHRSTAQSVERACSSNRRPVTGFSEPTDATVGGVTVLVGVGRAHRVRASRGR
jgi:hypothetical protein